MAMRKGFAILTHSADADFQTAILGAIQDRFQWWHQLPQAWIIVDHTGTETVFSVRDRLLQAAPHLAFVILEIQPGSAYAGWGPKAWEDWLLAVWKEQPRFSGH
jgi:hypothetical protein